MANEKSLVEEAIIQMKNLEEAVAENAKGILASTMSREIKELVKESLTEQDDEIEIDDVEIDEPMGSDDIADIDMGDDDSDEEGDDMDTEDMDFDDEEDMDFDDEEDMDDDEDTIDLTDADDEEVLRVFQLMGPDDNIVVTKDDNGNTHLKDEETGKEYMIVGEGEEEEMDESWEEMDESDDEEMYESDEEEMDESIESIVERMFSDDEDMDFDDEEETEIDFEEFDENWGGNKHDYKRRDGHKIGDVDGHYKDFEFDESDDMDDEIVYEIEMDDEEMDEQEEDSIYESKSTIKPKGVGMGKPKFSYNSKPNQGTGFKTSMKQGPKTMGTGKPKFEYKEGENSGSDLGKNKMVKKVETKEASRTLGNGSAFRKGGLPKPRAHSKANTAIKENTSNTELKILREKNEEYRKALNIFRNKLNEVAVFNSNLAYATRLFTEHSTSKQEKINILRRFDGVETIKESKNLYQSIKNELSEVTKTSQTVSESLERKIAKAPSTGSAVNLIESKTYENPQFLRMKDLMTKIK
jgi:topoisomerase-4 subunit A